MHPLKLWRQQNNLTQKELSKKVGCTSDFIGKIERGERTPSGDLAARIAALTQTALVRIETDDKDLPLYKESNKKDLLISSMDVAKLLGREHDKVCSIIENNQQGWELGWVAKIGEPYKSGNGRVDSIPVFYLTEEQFSRLMMDVGTAHTAEANAAIIQLKNRVTKAFAALRRGDLVTAQRAAGVPEHLILDPAKLTQQLAAGLADSIKAQVAEATKGLRDEVGSMCSSVNEIKVSLASMVTEVADEVRLGDLRPGQYASITGKIKYIGLHVPDKSASARVMGDLYKDVNAIGGGSYKNCSPDAQKKIHQHLDDVLRKYQLANLSPTPGLFDRQ